MEKPSLKWATVMLVGTLSFQRVNLKATTIFSESEANVYLACGGNLACETYEFSMGDFDGDGFEDLLYPSYSSGYSFGSGPDFVVFGDHFPAGGSVPSFRTTRIEAVRVGGLSQTNIGDITGDGRADTIHFRGSGAVCDVSLGRPSPPSLISQPANFSISGAPALSQGAIAFGDVNGDGKNDLIFYGGTTGTAYVVFGSTAFQTFSSTISLSNTAHVMTISGGGAGNIASGDVDGDGIDDIVIGDNKNLSSRTQPGVVYVIRGSTNLPSALDLATSSSSWKITGAGMDYLDLSFSADFTGDGKADLGLDGMEGPLLVSGADLLTKGPACTLAPGYANSLAPSSFPSLNNTGRWILPRDFDGDGRLDLCAVKPTGPTQKEIHLFLSHSFSVGSALPQVYPSANLQFTNVGNESVLGDLNGDGKSDLIYISETFPLLNVFYGYWPLNNPRVVVEPRESNESRIRLSLNVDGDPTEMRLSGDIADTFKDHWIPFVPNQKVTLTPTVGDKSVEVLFRNAFKRESDLVKASVPLTVRSQGVIVRTNRVKAGGFATLDCSLHQAGRIKAAVFNQAGEKVADLLDEEHTPGVWPVEWDGRNSQGNPVIPGVYILIANVDGQETKTSILVQR